MDSQDIQSNLPRLALRPLLMFASAVLVTMLTGNLLFDNLREGMKREVQQKIASVGGLRANQIHDWLEGRSADVRTLSGNSLFTREATRWILAGGRDDATRRRLVQRLGEFLNAQHFRAVVLYDAFGRVMLSVGDAGQESTGMGAEAHHVAATGQFRFIDLHRTRDASTPALLGFMSPLRDGDANSGVIYLVEDPARYLFPLIQKWPGDSATAETYLVRMDGDRILFLSQLLYRHDPPFGFSLPLETPQMTAASALLGTQGLLEHLQDYRGKPVLSHAATITGTPWVLISEIDEEEAYALVDQLQRVASFFALFIFGLFGAWFWQWRSREQTAAESIALKERLRADALQMEGEKHFRTVFEHTALPMVRNSLKGEFIEVNDAWCEMFGYSREEVLSRHLTWRQIAHPEDSETYAALVGKLLAGETEDVRVEKSFIRKDGKALWGGLQVSLVRDEQGAPEYFISAIQDITERKRAEQQISFMAYHDKLTGLPNRALLFDRLSKAMSQAKRDAKHVALLFADLDGFKAVNDEFGHEAGDAVLRMSAQRFLACVRAVDTVARFGGDEFAIVLGSLEDPQQAKAVAEKIVQAFAQSITLADGRDCHVGASVGISIYPEHGSAMDNLMVAADRAMYESKRAGKNIYTFFRENAQEKDESPWIKFDNTHLVGVGEIDEQHRNLVYLVNRLNDALQRDESSGLIMQMFDELLDATTHHFATESRYMKESHYPEQDKHEAEHAHLVNDVAHFKVQFQQGRELLVLQSIKDWLLNHIVYSDKRLGTYLVQHGMK